MYLEEKITKNAEFPEDGQFRLLTGFRLGTRYIVYGDAEGSGSHGVSAEAGPGPSQPGPSHSTASIGWSIPPLWAGTAANSHFSSRPTNAFVG